MNRSRSPNAVTVTDPKTLAERIEDLLPQTQCTKCGYDGCRPYAEAIAHGTANYNQCPPGGVEGVARVAALLGKPVIPINPVNGVERPRPVAFIDESLCIGCTLCMQACPVDAIAGAAKQMHTIIAELCTGCDLCVAPCPVDCIAMLPVTGEATGWDAWTQQQADAARVRHDRHLARLEREREASEARAAARRATASAGAGTGTGTGASASAGADANTGATASASVDANAANANTNAAGALAAAGADAGAAQSAPVNDADAKKRAIIQAALERARKKKEELAAKGQAPQNTANVSADVQAQINAAEARRQRLGIETQPGLQESGDERQPTRHAPEAREANSAQTTQANQPASSPTGATPASDAASEGGEPSGSRPSNNSPGTANQTAGDNPPPAPHTNPKR
ncbi:electron transport complex subunit RsxB [Paraburkholderia jirisanensis]